MSVGGQPGKKFCPYCKTILDTNVHPEKNENVVIHGIEAKRREIECTQCHKRWLTVEVIEEQLNDLINSKI